MVKNTEWEICNFLRLKSSNLLNLKKYPRKNSKKAKTDTEGWCFLSSPRLPSCSCPCCFLPLKKKICINFFGHTARKILVPLPRIELVPSAVEVQNLNHWSSREVPVPVFKNNSDRVFPFSVQFLLPHHHHQHLTGVDTQRKCRSISPPALSQSALRLDKHRDYI